MTNYKIDMDEEPEDKNDDFNDEKEKERLKSQILGKDKDGSIKNMKIDMGTIETDFKIPESKDSLESLDWNTDMFEEPPKELRQRWADREAWKLMKDYSDINPYEPPNKKGRMYVPNSYEEDYSDTKNLKVPQTSEKYKIPIGTDSELRRELNTLKEMAKKLESLKPYMGEATFNNILFEFNKDILPRIKFLESKLSLNISADYVDSEIKELYEQILKKYNLIEDNEPEDIESTDLETKPDYKIDLKENERELYEIDGNLYIVKPGTEDVFRIDFPEEE